jgi:hypothetical protein
MPEKRGHATSAKLVPRKARVARSRLDCLKSNPDRVISSPVAKLTQRDVTACWPQLVRGQQARAVRYQGRHPGGRDE